MVGFRFSLMVDVGFSAASRAPTRRLGDSTAIRVGRTSNAGLAPSRRSRRVPLEPLGKGPLEPERRIFRGV